MTQILTDLESWYDQNAPKVVTFDSIVEATKRIRPFVTKTPCMPSHCQKDFAIRLYYKMEFTQAMGSFKDRGVLYLLDVMPQDKKKIGVVLGSLGNFAISFCHRACKVKIPVIVVFPFSAPLNKVQKCHGFGAKVFLQGNDLQEAQKYARAIAKDKGMTYIESRDHPQLMAGYGSVATEILEQVPLVDAIIVPVGYGGLLAAVATVVKNLKPECLVYGVQAENAPTFFDSLAKTYDISLLPKETAADAIAMPCVGYNSFQIAQSLVDKMLLVKEDWITQAMFHLTEKEKFVVEGAGACPLATIIGKLVPEFKTKNVVCVLSGGNVHPLMYTRCLQRGLAAACCLVKFRVELKDHPTPIAQLMRLLSNGGYCIINPGRNDNRISIDKNIYNVSMSVICETQGLEHALQLKRIIDKAYPDSATFETQPFSDKTTCPCHVYKKSAYL